VLVLVGCVAIVLAVVVDVAVVVVDAVAAVGLLSSALPRPRLRLLRTRERLGS
jgi:hypothetical protein